MLVEGGYDGLTTRGLAEAAGVTVPTIYNLIGSKDDVLSIGHINGLSRVDILADCAPRTGRPAEVSVS